MDRLGVAKPFAWKFGKNQATGRSGFTLVEMLVVLAIMAIIALLVLPSLNGLFTSNSFTSNIYTLDGTLQQARSYAMANNTYVYVALDEVSGTSTMRNPTAGSGRVVVLVAAMSDGSDGITGTASPFTFSSANLFQISKLVPLNGVHIADVSAQTAGNMQRPSLTSTTSINVATATHSALTINYPLSGSSIYTSFPYVIGFRSYGNGFLCEQPYVFWGECINFYNP